MTVMLEAVVFVFGAAAIWNLATLLFVEADARKAKLEHAILCAGIAIAANSGPGWFGDKTLGPASTHDTASIVETALPSEAAAATAGKADECHQELTCWGEKASIESVML